jgi:hypothetical protein
MPSNKILPLLTATLAVTLPSMTLPLPAVAADPEAKTEGKIEYKDNGGYEAKRSSSQELSNGTEMSSSSKVDVDVDNDGEVTEKVKNQATNDPKGLMNKKQNIVTSKIDSEPSGDYKKTTKKKYKDAEGTDISQKTTVDVDADSDGTVKETVRNEKIVDPKGLFNRSKTVSTTKKVNGKVVESNENVD